MLSLDNPYSERRCLLTAQLQPAAVAVLVANDMMPSNADGTLPYHPNSNLVYLTGLDQTQTALVLCPDHPREEWRQILFIQRENDHFVKWFGPGLSFQDAVAKSGVDTVYYFDELATILHQLIIISEHLYLLTNEHPRSENQVPTADDRLLSTLRQAYPLHQYHRLYPLLGRLRTVKSPSEVTLLRQASAVSETGFRQLLRTVRPGIMEYQLEAELVYAYGLQGARPAYQPIVATGRHTCALHYHANNQMCHAGELLLVDAAAAWQYYNADLTRTIPISGYFTPRQRAYYEAVLRVHRQMAQQMRAGCRLSELQLICNELLIEELINLGLCSMQDVQTHGAGIYLDRYCYHNFSHFLGLDVHDVGFTHEPLLVGTVLTNEPGIYCREEGIGVRLENNLLLTHDGFEDLTVNIPIDPDEIEHLMQLNNNIQVETAR